MINHIQKKSGNTAVSTLDLEMEYTLFTTYYIYYTFAGQEYLIIIWSVQRNPILRDMRSAHIFKPVHAKNLHIINAAHGATLIALALKLIVTVYSSTSHLNLW